MNLIKIVNDMILKTYEIKGAAKHSTPDLILINSYYFLGNYIYIYIYKYRQRSIWCKHIRKG